jgi:hypothetical protein
MMKRPVDRAGNGEPSAATRDVSDGAAAKSAAGRERSVEAAADGVARDTAADDISGAAGRNAAADVASSGVARDAAVAVAAEPSALPANAARASASDCAARESTGDTASTAERAIADEERRAPREAYPALLARLSRQSVTKRYEAFRDIDWEAPDFAVRDDDSRWELGPDDPLGGTAWYRAKSPAERARIGLYRVATFMKVGVQFENVLSRGLLLFILSRSEQSPEHRYAYHELIEESHHSMMFSEFVRRSGFDISGLTPRLAWLGTRVANLAARFPELFFVFVLGGEDPIDHAQRLALSGQQNLHPLLRRISQIHITEEARHLCFARSFLREYVPRLHPLKRMALAATAPIILRITAELMLRPPPALIREFDIPAAVVAEAFTNNRAYRRVTLDSLAKVYALMRELGLVTRQTAPLWRALGTA